MMRLLAVLFGLVLGCLGVLSTAQAAIAVPTPSHVHAYEYDRHQDGPEPTFAVTGRGPPGLASDHTIYDTVDRWLQDASVRPKGSATPTATTTTYAYTGALAQHARADWQLEAFSGGILPVERSQVAAKTGRTGARTCLKSFTGSTLVLMADGTKKPIEDIEVGDRVVATDPETGERVTRKVTRVWVHDDEVLDLVVEGEAITTTEGHLFWTVTDRRFERADELADGEVVRGDGGREILVSGFRLGSQRIVPAYNLSIADVHTYHVGDSSVLVHNDCYEFGGEAANFSDDELAQFVYQHVGEGDLAGRPALDQIARVMQRGTPTRIRDDAVQFDLDGIRVIINESMPWRSTAVVRNGG
jgi:hypothetical protein